MKKLLLILLCCLPIFSYSQEPYVWNAEGEVISYINGDTIESLNTIFEKHFKEYELFGFDDFTDEKGDKYDITFQKFSYEPLFISGNLSKKQIKRIPKVMQEFRDRYRFRDLNIEANNMIEYDIKDAIEKGLTDYWFLKALGKPDYSYKDSESYKSYEYEGTRKSIVLIFNNGIITDYRIHNGL